MLVDIRAGFDWWFDGWLGVKPDFRDCYAQPKNKMTSSFLPKTSIWTKTEYFESTQHQNVLAPTFSWTGKNFLFLF